MISCTQKHFHHQATKHLVKLLFYILGKVEERERERGNQTEAAVAFVHDTLSTRWAPPLKHRREHRGSFLLQQMDFKMLHAHQSSQWGSNIQVNKNIHHELTPDELVLRYTDVSSALSVKHWQETRVCCRLFSLSPACKHQRHIQPPRCGSSHRPALKQLISLSVLPELHLFVALTSPSDADSSLHLCSLLLSL